MDSRKRTRITRDRLLLADYEAWAQDGTPATYRTYVLPKTFKVWFQFFDPIKEAFWSVELFLEIENDNAKLLEVTPRGLTYKRGLWTDTKNYIYKTPTEAVTAWQLGLVKNNLTNLIAHSIELVISRLTYLQSKTWELRGNEISNEEFQEIRAEIALKKRELFTPEKAQEVRKVLDQERKRAKESGTRYRGNEVISEVFGISVKTAEKWSARVSANRGRKQQRKKKGG